MGRTVNVIIAVALGLSVVGFFVGMSPMPKPNLERTFERPVNVESAPASRPYWELRHRPYGPNAAVTSDLAVLRETLPGLLDPVQRNPRDTLAAISTRTERRAYDGAPPTIPHAIDEKSPFSCLACHQSGVEVAGKRAPVISHPAYASCTQCHVSIDDDTIAVENSFAGARAVAHGERAWPGAPPSIPHTLLLREQCGSCHGAVGLDGIRTTHPQRHSCQQCHVPRPD